MKKLKQLLCSLLAMALLACALPVWAEEAAGAPALDGTGPAEGTAPASEAQQGQPAEASPAEAGGAQAPAQLQAAAAPQAEWGADYETADEFTISTEAELRAFAAMVNEGKDFAGKTVKLANSIDLGGGAWTPVDDFRGAFDGQGNSITGFVLTGEEKNRYLGFFAEINGAGLLRNLNVQGTAAVTTGRVRCAGLLVGRIRSTGGIENCTVSGTLDVQKSAASAQIGGVVGESRVPITNCTFSGSVSVEARGDAGGIAGKASNSIINCVNEGTVYAADGTAGGIAGTINTSSQENGVLRGCINRGPVKSNEDEAGGITGSAYSVRIEECRNTGSVATGFSSAGGIAGENSGGSEIVNCQNSGEISGNQEVGGIVGLLGGAMNGGSVLGCTNTGSVRGIPDGNRDSQFIGGIFGGSNSAAAGTLVSECTNTGEVSGHSTLGGIGGQAYDNISITGCVNEGNVSATGSNAGGIVGSLPLACTGYEVQPSSSVENCANHASVTGAENVGGIAGTVGRASSGSSVVKPPYVNNNVSTGSVSGTGENIGAIVGENASAEIAGGSYNGRVEHNYWPDSLGKPAVGGGSAAESADVRENVPFDEAGRLKTPVEINGQRLETLGDALETSAGAEAPQAVQKLTLTFRTAYGTAPQAMEVVRGVSVVLPGLAADGYTFQGWKAADGTLYPAGAAYTAQADETFAAVWQAGTGGGPAPAAPSADAGQKPNPKTGV